MTEVKLAARMAAMTESATLALNARAKRMAAEGHTVYNLTAGELASDTPPFIREAVAPTLSQNKYTPVAGLPELRQKIAAHAQHFYGLDWVKSPNVVVSGGAKPALHAAFMALLNEGDEVIVPVPAWVSYISLIELTGAQAVKVPLTPDYDLDVNALMSKVSGQTKMIILNSPHNPTGSVFSRAAVADLAERLKGSGITVLADDIYSKLVFDDDYCAVPKAGFENLVIVNGFSKSQALTGWRIGYLIASEPVAEAATTLLSHMTGNAALPSQHAALAAMDKHDQPPRETLDTLRRNRRLAVDGLGEAGIKHSLPGGAFYVFLDLTSLTDNSAEWCERLLVETGVALVPGEAFGAPGYARLSFVADQAVLEPALLKIKEFVGGDG